MIQNEDLLKIDNGIKERYNKYKELFAQISILTNEIKELEQNRSNIIEKDGRKLVFRKPIIDLKGFNNWLKFTEWCEVHYENFEENNKKYITDEAMIVSVYCYQVNYLAPVEFIMSLEGYLSKEEYDNKRIEIPTLKEYYIDENNNDNERKKI
jgi:hypothetical protein